jgi:hypothetical protein
LTFIIGDTFELFLFADHVFFPSRAYHCALNRRHSRSFAWETRENSNQCQRHRETIAIEIREGSWVNTRRRAVEFTHKVVFPPINSFQFNPNSVVQLLRLIESYNCVHNQRFTVIASTQRLQCFDIHASYQPRLHNFAFI